MHRSPELFRTIEMEQMEVLMVLIHFHAQWLADAFEIRVSLSLDLQELH